MKGFVVGFYVGLAYIKRRYDTLEAAYDGFWFVIQEGFASAVNLVELEGATTVVGWDKKNGEMFSPMHPNAERILKIGSAS